MNRLLHYLTKFNILALTLWCCTLIAQGQSSYSYDYTTNGVAYNITAAFTTPWAGANNLEIKITNKSASAISLQQAQVWYECPGNSSWSSCPSLGGLSYPSSVSHNMVEDTPNNIMQETLNFPTDAWAVTKLAANATFSVMLSLDPAATNYQAIASSVRLYLKGWTTPVLFTPVTVLFSGNGGNQDSVYIKNTVSNQLTAKYIASGTALSLRNNSNFLIWASHFISGNQLYTATQSKASPLTFSTPATSSVTLSFTTSTIPTVDMPVVVSGLPSGATATAVISSATGATYNIRRTLNLSNGSVNVNLPVQTYNISISNYLDEASNIVALPAAANVSYTLTQQPSALQIVFKTTAIGQNLVNGWPRYLAHGSVTLGSETNDAGLMSSKLDAVFKYSGYGGDGDPGLLLDPSHVNYPTMLTIEQTRRMEKYYNAHGYTNSKVMPVMVHYTAQASLGGVGGNDVNNRTNLQIHYRNLIREIKKMLSYKDADHPYPATLILSPDLLGAQQQVYGQTSFNYDSVYVKYRYVNEEIRNAFTLEGISTDGLPQFDSNWRGYYQSINYICHVIGQESIPFGWQDNMWATGTALWVYDSADLAAERARQVSDFIKETLGVYSGEWKPTFFVLDRYECDCFGPCAKWYYAYNALSWTRFVNYAQKFGEYLGVPVMLWQVPGGHLANVTETLTSEQINNHSSASATYFFGDASIGSNLDNINASILNTGLTPSVYNGAATVKQWLARDNGYDYSAARLGELPAKNIFAVLWGGGQTTSAIAIGSNGDDGGWLAARINEYNAKSKAFFVDNTVATPSISTANATSFCTGSSAVLLSSATSGNQWYLNGNAIAGATSRSYTAKEAGTYTCIASVGSLTSNPSNAIKITTNTLLATPVISQSGSSLVATVVQATSYQWYLNGNAISGATTSTLTPAGAGSYTVMAFNAAGCSSSLSAAYTVLSTGTNATGVSAARIYPVPAKDEINIEFAETPDAAIQIQLVNLMGEEMERRETSARYNQLSLKGLASGWYVIRITGSNRNEHYKIFKE
jgi:hypothetical protein